MVLQVKIRVLNLSSILWEASDSKKHNVQVACRWLAPGSVQGDQTACRMHWHRQVTVPSLQEDRQWTVSGRQFNSRPSLGCPERAQWDWDIMVKSSLMLCFHWFLEVTPDMNAKSFPSPDSIGLQLLVGLGHPIAPQAIQSAPGARLSRCPQSLSISWWLLSSFSFSLSLSLYFSYIHCRDSMQHVI